MRGVAFALNHPKLRRQRDQRSQSAKAASFSIKMATTTEVVITMATAPPGYTINLVNPPWIGYQLVTTAGICMAMSTSLLSLRLLTRKLVLQSVRWDDFLITVAWVSPGSLVKEVAPSIVNAKAPVDQSQVLATTLGIADIICEYHCQDR